MELDDLKGAWTQYDKKLSKNLKLNEELLKKITKNNSKQELQKPINMGIISLIVMFLVGVYITFISIQYIAELKFSLPGFFSVFIGSFNILISIMTINRYLSIDYIGSPIVKLRKDITKLNMFILRTRKYEFFIAPFTVISILPIIYKSIANVDIYNDIKKFTLEVLFIICISFTIGIFYNKYFVDRKISNANRILEELEKFEKEE